MNHTNDPGAQLAGLLADARRSSDHELVRSAMSSKGDITRITGYDNLEACIKRLKTIDAGKGAMGQGLTTVVRAHAVFTGHRADFQAAFAEGGSEAVRLAYANAATALWHVVTLLCAEAVSFDPPKGGRGTPVIGVNRGGAARVATLTPVRRLTEFCDQAEKSGFKRLIREDAVRAEYEAGALVEFFGPAAGLAAKAVTAVTGAMGTVGTVATGVGLAIAATIALVYGARWLAEYYYSTRGQVATWLETQATFLKTNATALGQGSKREGQEKWAERLRRLADRVRVDADDAERLVTAPHGQTRTPSPGPGLGSVGSLV